MSRKLLVGVIVLFGSFLSAVNLFGQTDSHSQPAPAKPAAELVPVWRVQVVGANEVTEEVGTYYSYDEAEQAEKRWYEQHPNSLKLTKIVEGKGPKPEARIGGRGPNTPEAPLSGPKGTTIVKPDLPWVDPGSLPDKPAAKAPPIGGKTGKGTIDGSDVTMEFEGQGDKGEFTMSGQVQDKGKWMQLGPYVQMETEFWKYEGKLDGKKLTGTRTFKTDKSTNGTWTVTLMNKPKSPVATAEKAGPPAATPVDTPQLASDQPTLDEVIKKVAGNYRNTSNKGTLKISPKGDYIIYSWTGAVDDRGSIVSFHPSHDYSYITIRSSKGFDRPLKVTDDFSAVNDFPYERE